MKRLWPLCITIAIAAAIIVNVAHAAPAPPVVGKQFYKDNASAIRALGGQARLSPNVICRTTPKKIIYICTFKGTTYAGREVCENYYIAYRPGYHTLPWPLAWKCGGKPTPLPPTPPLARFHPINAITSNTPGA